MELISTLWILCALEVRSLKPPNYIYELWTSDIDMVELCVRVPPVFRGRVGNALSPHRGMAMSMILFASVCTSKAASKAPAWFWLNITILIHTVNGHHCQTVVAYGPMGFPPHWWVEKKRQFFVRTETIVEAILRGDNLGTTDLQLHTITVQHIWCGFWEEEDDDVDDDDDDDDDVDVDDEEEEDDKQV